MMLRAQGYLAGCRAMARHTYQGAAEKMVRCAWQHAVDSKYETACPFPALKIPVGEQSSSRQVRARVRNDFEMLWAPALTCQQQACVRMDKICACTRSPHRLPALHLASFAQLWVALLVWCLRGGGKWSV